MATSGQNNQDGIRAPATAIDGKELPFRVELWRSGADVETVLGLARNAALARAIFQAAVVENPGRRITLRQGETIIQESC